LTHIATKSIPIVSNLFKSFAISILVPTPSVEATIFGFLNFFGISDIEPKPPIFLNFDLFLLCFAFFDRKSTNLSALVHQLNPKYSFLDLMRQMGPEKSSECQFLNSLFDLLSRLLNQYVTHQ
jgi:hypothetical protein